MTNLLFLQVVLREHTPKIVLHLVVIVVLVVFRVTLLVVFVLAFSVNSGGQATNVTRK